MKLRSAISTDLFAADTRRKKIDRLGDPLKAIEEHIDLAAPAAEADRAAPRPMGLQGGRDDASVAWRVSGDVMPP